jgi:prolyl 4-hydroxylase
MGATSLAQDAPRVRRDLARIALLEDLRMTSPFPAPPFERIIVSEDPRIRVVKRLLPPEVCDELIELGRRGRRAEVFDAAGYLTVGDERTNSAAAVNPAHPAVAFARQRISQATGMPVGAMEVPAVLHYEVGQSFSPHFDFFDADAPGHKLRLLRGQRLVTALVYLNDDYEGGETDFPRLGLKAKGRKGDAVYWANLGADHQPDRRMLHAGLPPTRGEKWVLSQWIRNRTLRRVEVPAAPQGD